MNVVDVKIRVESRNLKFGRSFDHQIVRHVAIGAITILVPALIHEVREVVEVGGAIIVIHVPARRSDEHVVLSTNRLWHEAVAT